LKHHGNSIALLDQLMLSVDSMYIGISGQIMLFCSRLIGTSHISHVAVCIYQLDVKAFIISHVFVVFGIIMICVIPSPCVEYVLALQGVVLPKASLDLTK